jgi:hypothetical protein
MAASSMQVSGVDVGPQHLKRPTYWSVAQAEELANPFCVSGETVKLAIELGFADGSVQ